MRRPIAVRPSLSGIYSYDRHAIGGIVKTCPECSTNVHDDAMACPECGGKWTEEGGFVGMTAPAPTPPPECPQCGEPLGSSSSREGECSRCKTYLVRNAETGAWQAVLPSPGSPIVAYVAFAFGVLSLSLAGTTGLFDVPFAFATMALGEMGRRLGRRRGQSTLLAKIAWWLGVAAFVITFAAPFLRAQQ
jgi:hypothetical protein